MSAATLHIVVDVLVDGDQILGHVGDGVTEPRPFSGWLGLIGALDGLVRVAADEVPSASGAPTSRSSTSAMRPTITRLRQHLPDDQPEEHS